MAVCVFSGIGLDKFVDNDETEFYKVNMTTFRRFFLHLQFLKKIERLREKLYLKIELNSEEKHIVIKKELIIPVYP